MSEIKYAIETLKSLNFCGNCTTGAEKEGGCAACKRIITKDIAIQALTEKLEREQGCEYCNNNKNGLHSCNYCGEGVLRVFSNSAEIVIKGKWYSFPIEYCPKCGRRLQND